MDGSDRLTSRTIRGVLWSFTDRFAQQLVGFAVSIILARLLVPAEFGLMAMLTIFIALSQVLISGGLGEALVQKADASHLDECTVFYFNLAMSIVAAALLCVGAPAIALFYEMPMLTPMARLLSLSVIINAFGLIQWSLMIKRVDFKKQTIVSLCAGVCAGAVGVSMAMTGWGVWSLVWQANAGSLLRTILLWYVHGWRPARRFSLQSLRQMWRFGSNLLATGVLDTLFKNAYLIVIGKAFSAIELGLYARATTIQQLPVKDIAISADVVSFPVLASIQHDPARVKRGVRQGLMIQAMMTFPVMIGMACVARPLVLVLLTEKWVGCVVYLQLLCLAGLFYPISVLNTSVLKARGRSDLLIRLELLKRVLIALSICITFPLGLTAMVVGQVVTGWLSFYLNARYSAGLIAYPFAEQMKDAAPSLLAAIAMGGCVLAVGSGGWETPGPELLAQVATGAVVYVGLCRLFRLSPFMTMMEWAGRQLDAGRRPARVAD